MFSKIMLGTVQFGLDYGISNPTGEMPLSEAGSIINLAKKVGIKSIDTAISYGNAESKLGRVGISEFEVFTKISEVPMNSVKIGQWIEHEIQNSLTRLGVTQLQGVILHRPQQLVDKRGKEIMRSLKQLKDAKVFKKFGVSIYSPSELPSILKTAEIDIVQAPINIIDNRLELTGWIYKLNDLGIEIHARSIFLQGLLLMSKEKIPNRFKPWELILNQWHNWLIQNHDISAAQACLNYIYKKVGVDKIIVGVNNLEQFKQLIQIIKEPIDMVLPNLTCEDENLINPSLWPVK